jgi:hypothetical protein
MTNPIAMRYAAGIRYTALAMGWGISAIWFATL